MHWSDSEGESRGASEGEWEDVDEPGEEVLEAKERACYARAISVGGPLEREVFGLDVVSPSDLETMETWVRGTLRCEFGACSALETGAYAALRLRLLRAARKGVPGDATACAKDVVHMGETLALVVLWACPPRLSLMERPRARSVLEERAVSKGRRAARKTRKRGRWETEQTGW